VIIINETISELSEQIATDRFENCKLIKSLECLDRIIAEFPTTKVINEIKVERDSMLFDLYCFSKKLDSVYSFLSLYKSSGFIKDAKLLFKRIFEDSITRLSSAIIFDNWESITTDFHLKFKTYLELNNCDENIKLKYESLFFNGLSLESSKNKIDWFLQEFPNSLNIYKIKEIDKIITLNDNVAFYKEKTGINQNKYGLLNMSSRNFLVDCFFEEVNKFCNGLAAVKLYGKWGFINKKGQIIIPFIYNEARNFNDNITGVELEGVWFFIDQNGYKVSENQYLYIGEFENGLVNVKPYTGGWIYIDNDEQIKSPTSYYNATSFRNNVAAVSTKAQEVLLIDQSFKILKDITEDLTYFIPYYGYQSESKDIISFYYSDKLKKHIINTCVYYDKNQTLQLPPPSASDFSEFDLRYDLTGNFLVNGRDIIYYFEGNDFIHEYTVRDNDVITYFNYYGSDFNNPHYQRTESILSPEVEFKLGFSASQLKPFDLVSFNKDFAVIEKQTGFGIINRNGVLVNNHCSFDRVTLFIDGISVVSSSAGYFLMDTSGKKCSGLYSFINRISDDVFIVSEKGSLKSFIINRKGQVLSASYDFIEAKILNNTLLVSNSIGYKNHVELKEYGLIDINGKVLVPLVYDNVIRTYSNLVFGKCPEGIHWPSNFDIFDLNGSKVESLVGYSRNSWVDSEGLKFFKVHYIKSPNSEGKRIIDDEYLLPNF